MHRPSSAFVISATALLVGALTPAAARSQTPNQTYQVGIDAAGYVSPLQTYEGTAPSPLREVVERYQADRSALLRRYSVEYSPERRTRLGQFTRGWLEQLHALDFESLPQEGRLDYVLLRNTLESELAELTREERRWGESAPLVPFAPVIFDLMENRREFRPLDQAAAAKTLAALADSIEAISKAVVAANARANGAKAANGDDGEGDPSLAASRIVIYRTADMVESLRRTLQDWDHYYTGYDPLFTWWAAEPYKRVNASLESYRKALREKVLGIAPGEDDPIVGDPIGRDAIIADLRFEMIPYTPEQLVAIAEQEFKWSEAEMLKASREMGFGDDWKAALEKVKTLHVPPGEQPELIRNLAFEAIDFVEQRNLVTVPPLARDIFRMEMMSPERQKVAPFFLGGETILVSFPTDGMEQEYKEMSLRGNNIHFSRATVFHELIPGHHLQGFMSQRYNPHRRLFSTPFFSEGWSLYWEMLLWDKGFQQSPENRVGALFWRMHRSARIIFSLGFHLGTMTPQEAIDFLVDRVGHERANATAEVRRSFNGSYSPLYQVAYMMGGLQFRALHKELVDSGRMTDKEFHDAILKGGPMPVELVRARLTNAPLTADYTAGWRFYGEVQPR
jgi:uncharacterized protein (DUF885 family)